MSAPLGIQLPVDYEQLHGVRLLAARYGREAVAHIVLRLWLDLAYAAKVAGLGRMTQRQEEVFLQGMSDYPGLAEVLADPEMGLLVRQGDDVYCEAFARHNPHWDPNFKPHHAKIAAKRHFDERQSKLMRDNRAAAPGLFDGEWSATQGIDQAEVPFLQKIIRSVDNALSMSGRTHFPAELWVAAKGLGLESEEQVDELARFIFLHNGDHRIKGLSTEKLLPLLPKILADFGVEIKQRKAA